MRALKNIKLKKDIVIPIGKEFMESPRRVEYDGNSYECLVGFGNDHTARFIVDRDLMEEFKDSFNYEVV